MQSGEGEINAIFYEEAEAAGSVLCAPGLIPAAGQYTLAVSLLKSGETAEILTVPLFLSGQEEDGFAFAARMPEHWKPGTPLLLRGPIGHGFSLPSQVKRAALVAAGRTSARLRGLLPGLMAQRAETALVRSEERRVGKECRSRWSP